MGREAGTAMQMRTTVPVGSQIILLAGVATQSNGIELCQRRKERHLDHAWRTPNLDRAIDRCAVAHFWPSALRCRVGDGRAAVFDGPNVGAVSVRSGVGATVDNHAASWRSRIGAQFVRAFSSFD